MEREHLHLLIDEEIYILPGDITASEEAVSSADGSTQEGKIEEKVVVSIESEMPQEPKAPENQSPEKSEEPEATSESVQIPAKPKAAVSQVWSFAIFHDSTSPAEKELLAKIIGACKLNEADYQIFENGFDQTVKFQKALVFVPEARAFYTPLPYKGSEFLCSKPLSLLINDPKEKAKLWGALQKFVDSLL